ncbi:MAG: hypothetical protein ABS81_02800 [Pseudonocardia sp. SCN 72-86]|nr:MAG: hypothetical protein ABS81_02800 [Pseudonocardia sp. SCN 72-86]
MTAVGIAEQRRQHEVRSGSARAWLLTVLSLYVFPEPRPIPTAALLYALQLFGFDSKASRQALNRAAASGWIEARKDGRRAMWDLTLTGHQLMMDGRRRLQNLESVDRQWDGRFVLVNASVPQSQRALRHKIRTRLTWLGFGVMSPATWISIRLDAEQDAVELLNRLKIDGASTFIATPGRAGDFQEVVRRAWDLDALASEYRAFIEEFATERPGEGDDVLIAYTRLVHSWRRFPFMDPTLPAALLPSGWPGDEAVRVYQSLQSMWRPAAAQRWSEIVATAIESR